MFDEVPFLLLVNLFKCCSMCPSAMHYETRNEAGLLFVGDVIVFFLSLWVTLLVRYFDIPHETLFYDHLIPFSILSVAWVLVFFIAGLYDKHTEFLKRRLPGIILHAQVINIVIAAGFFFFIPYFGITPKTNLMIYLIVSSALLILWRLVIVEYFVPRRKRKALIIGEGEEVETLVREVNRNTRYGFSFVRILHADLLEKTEDVSKQLRRTISEEGISLVVADSRGDSTTPLARILFSLAFSDHQIRFIDLSTMYESIFDRIPLSLVRYDWFLANLSRSSHVIEDALKRVIDIVGSLLVGTVFLILLPFVWIAIKLDDGGALFISQKRMGIRGSVMTVYKIRTMQIMEDGVWIAESTNKVTRIGAFLRKTSIDELPQVWNILKGEMSLIGPRNDLVGHAERLGAEIPFYAVRTMIKPGVTGWAQTHQQYGEGQISPQSVEETQMRLAYDLYYIKHRSFLLDISIALRTIKTLLSRFGINIKLR